MKDLAFSAIICIAGVGYATSAFAAGHMESSEYPIHVYYNTEKELAKATLLALEETWNAQVVEGSFAQPYMINDAKEIVPGIRVEIADLGPYGGTVQPVGDIPQTAACDCTSQLVISSGCPVAAVPEVVAHEFVHAVQNAIDCGESFSAHENFAVAISDMETPNAQFTKTLLPSFQQYPDLPLDFINISGETEPRAYHLGAALYPIFLAERFGGGKVAFLAKLWNAYPQDGTITVANQVGTCSNPNKPNWFDGTDTVLKEMGSSFDDAFDEFSVWRAIAGTHDDGKHFSRGAQYPAASTAANHTLDTFPIEGDLDVHEYGSRHIELHPGTYNGPIQVAVTGAMEGTWGASVLLWKADQPVQRVVLSFENEKGTTLVDWDSEVVRGVLVVTHKNFAGHNPDDMIYDVVRPFSYLLDIQASEPSPEAGAEAGPDVEADALVQVDTGTAVDGARDSGGQPSQQDSATIGQDATPEAGASSPLPAAAPADDSGCGCKFAGQTRSVGSGLLLSLQLLAVGVAVRRLKRRPSQYSGS